MFDDGGAAFHLLSSLFHTGGPAKRNRASFSLTLAEKLAFGRPVAQHSLLLHARSNAHAPAHAAPQTPAQVRFHAWRRYSSIKRNDSPF